MYHKNSQVRVRGDLYCNKQLPVTLLGPSFRGNEGLLSMERGKWSTLHGGHTETQVSGTCDASAVGNRVA